MAIQLVATAPFNDGETASTNPISGTIPSAAQPGDLGLFIALVNTAATSTFTPPSGWSSLSGPDNTGGNTQSQVWVKDLVSADPGSSVSWSNSASPSRFIGLMGVYRGTQGAGSVILGGPTLTNAANTSLVEPTLTTLVPFSWVVGLWAFRAAVAAPGPTLSYPGTETFDDRSRTAFAASPNYTLELSHLTAPGPTGSYGGTTATSSASSGQQNLYAVAIPPALMQEQTPNRARFRAANW
jgi:hypothetical protein